LSDFLDSDMGEILVEDSEHSDCPFTTGTDGTWRKFTKLLVKKTNEVPFLKLLAGYVVCMEYASKCNSLPQSFCFGCSPVSGSSSSSLSW